MRACSNLKVLLLCGGESSRMGRAKHTLTLAGIPLTSRSCEKIQAAVTTADTVYVSLRDPTQATDNIQTKPFHILYDIDIDGTLAGSDIGPAAGLLAAHHHDRTSHWMIIACDFPLISVTDLRQLVSSYERPITCFENAKGWPEPLLAIWSPEALRALECSVRCGITGPIRTLQTLGSKKLKPFDSRSLLNTNTPAEWEAALTIADEMFADQ